MAMSRILGDERRRGVTRQKPWRRRRPRPRSPGLSRGTSERALGLGPHLRPHHRRDGRRLLRHRRHEVHDRRLAGRLADDGPDGPLCPRRGPAPPGCVPWRSRGPLGCREPVLKRSRGLAEIGAVPSVGSVGDSYDNALAESVNAFYKAELVFGPGRGALRDVSHREAVTMSSFTWWNETRIHGYLGERSPPVRAGLRGTRPHH